MTAVDLLRLLGIVEQRRRPAEARASRRRWLAYGLLPSSIVVLLLSVALAVADEEPRHRPMGIGLAVLALVCLTVAVLYLRRTARPR